MRPCAATRAEPSRPLSPRGPPHLVRFVPLVPVSFLFFVLPLVFLPVLVVLVPVVRFAPLAFGPAVPHLGATTPRRAPRTRSPPSGRRPTAEERPDLRGCDAITDPRVRRRPRGRAQLPASPPQAGGSSLTDLVQQRRGIAERRARSQRDTCDFEIPSSPKVLTSSSTFRVDTPRSSTRTPEIPDPHRWARRLSTAAPAAAAGHDEQPVVEPAAAVVPSAIVPDLLMALGNLDLASCSQSAHKRGVRARRWQEPADAALRVPRGGSVPAVLPLARLVVEA